MNALYAGCPATGRGTVTRPWVSRLETSSRAPRVREIVAAATLSGVPSVSFAKWVYFNVTKLRPLTIQEPSPVKMRRMPPTAEPVVPAVFAVNRSLVSVRLASR